MKVGIIGFLGSGKTTLFNSLSDSSSPTKSNVCVVKIPDERLEKLVEVFKPKKLTPSEVLFQDFPGYEYDLRENALSKKCLEEIKKVDLIVAIHNSYTTDDLQELSKKLKSSINDIETECIINDASIIENRLERSKREGKKSNDKELLEKILKGLEENTPLRNMHLEEHELKEIAGFRFLSQIPLIHIVNCSEEILKKDFPLEKNVLKLCCKIEEEIASLNREEKNAFLQDFGLTESAKDRLLLEAYKQLHLIPFFTVGEDEVRSWDIPKGINAQKAAGKIHSDIERGFIRAEVINFQEFIELGSLHKAKEAGKLRLEGKEYIVKDGDIINFRFNV